jgi:protein arginine kinase
MIPDIIHFEHAARQSLLETSADAVDDKAFRALGALRSARQIDTAETMHLLSQLRLGINLRRLGDVELQTVNDLFLLTQPAHLQRIHNRAMDAKERASVRAAFIRNRLN